MMNMEQIIENEQTMFSDDAEKDPIEDIVILVVPPDSQTPGRDKKQRQKKIKSKKKKTQMNIIEPIRLGYQPVVNPVPKTIIETAIERAKLNKLKKDNQNVDLTISHSKTLLNGLQQCKLCNKLFSKSIQLHNHMKVHYGPPTLKALIGHPCKLCGKEFPILSKLMKHSGPCAERLEKARQKREISQIFFICTICKKRYSSKSALKKHFHRTSQVPNHKIKSDSSYSQKKIKKQLKGYLQEEIIDLYTCPYCFRVFESHVLLKDHIKSKYSGCVKKYYQYRCKNCKEVMSYSNVNNHKCALIYHKCFVCEESFTKKTELLVHLRISHAKKCYVCIICRKKVYAPFLKAHKQSHLKQGAYECNECNAEFSTKFDLERHLDKQHGGKMFTCEICRRIYFSKREYNTHFKLHKV